MFIANSFSTFVACHFTLSMVPVNEESLLILAWPTLSEMKFRLRVFKRKVLCKVSLYTAAGTDLNVCTETDLY